MDDNVISQQFKKLEEKVEQLVQACRNLKNANTALEAKIQDLEQALKKKDATAQRLMEERSMIRARIDDLLSKLDQVGGERLDLRNLGFWDKATGDSKWSE